MEESARKKENRLELWVGALFFVAVYLVAFFIGSSEFQGIQESFWAARSLYKTILGFGLIISILIAVVLYLKLSFTANKVMKYLIVIISAPAFFLLFWATTVYVNKVLDKGDPEVFDIHVTDAFVLELQSRGGEIFHDAFVAFDVPEELRNYSVIELNSSALDEFPLGKEFRVERHSGFLGLPWSVMPKRLSVSRDIYKNALRGFDPHEPYYASGKLRLKILSAHGKFTQGSTMSRLLKKYKIPENKEDVSRRVRRERGEK